MDVKKSIWYTLDWFRDKVYITDISSMLKLQQNKLNVDLEYSAGTVAFDFDTITAIHIYWRDIELKT